MNVLGLFLLVVVILQQAAHIVPHPYMVCGDPESGTDHSMKDATACCLIWDRVHTGTSRETVTRLFCAILALKC